MLQRWGGGIGMATVFILTNAPSLLIPPPSSLPLQSSYVGVLDPSQQPTPLQFRDWMPFSTSPIEYRLREINKKQNKIWQFWSKTYWNMQKYEIKLSDFRFVSNILSSPAIIHANKWDQGLSVHYLPLPLFLPAIVAPHHTPTPTPPPTPTPLWKMHRPQGFYANKYGI